MFTITKTMYKVISSFQTTKRNDDRFESILFSKQHKALFVSNGTIAVKIPVDYEFERDYCLVFPQGIKDDIKCDFEQMEFIAENKAGDINLTVREITNPFPIARLFDESETNMDINVIHETTIDPELLVTCFKHIPKGSNVHVVGYAKNCNSMKFRIGAGDLLGTEILIVKLIAN